MLWKLINFSIELPPEWTPFAREVFPSSESCMEESSLLHLNVKLSPQPLKTVPLEEDVFFEEKKEGQWRMDWKRKEILCYLHPLAYIPYCISSMLVKIIKTLGDHSGLFFCHAACVMKKDKAWLIPGKEGRGKSTLARLLNLPLLNEDLSLLSIQKKSLHVYKVPDPQRLDGPRPFFLEGPFPVKKTILIRREFPEGLYHLSPEDSLSYILEEECVFNNPCEETDFLKKWVTQCETLLIAYTPEKTEWIQRLLDKD